jgi:hypothetical protein
MGEKHFGFDRAQASFDATKTPEGYLRGRALISRTGVFEYRASEFGLPGGDRVIRVLRHPDDVFNQESLRSFRQVPITIEHQAMLDASNVGKFKVGQLGSELQVNSPYVESDLVVDAKEGVDAVEAGGKREVSCGYWFQLVEERGEFEGQPYEFRQTQIRGNHLALTDAARLGPELRISVDSKNFPCAVQGRAGLDSHPQRREPHMSMVKIALDGGLSYDAAPEVAVAFDALKRKAQEAIDALEAAKTEKTGLQAKLDAAEAAKKTAEDALKAERDGMAEKVAAAAKDRADLLAIAQEALDAEALKDLDGKDAQEIKRAIILSQDKGAEETLKGKDATYVDAYFDSVRGRLQAKQGEDGLAATRAAGAPQNRGQDSNPYSKAAKDHRDRVLNKHKDPLNSKAK